MNTILLDGSFFDMACLLPVLLGLGLAGLLGWLLKSFLGGGSTNSSSDLQGKYTKLEADLQLEREKNTKLSAENKKKKSNTENMALGATAAVAGTAEIASLNGKLKVAKDELKKANEAKPRNAN